MLFDPENLQILQLSSCGQAVRCHSDVEEEYLNISKSMRRSIPQDDGLEKGIVDMNISEQAKEEEQIMNV